MKKLFLIGVLFSTLFFGLNVMAGDTNMWLEIDHVQFSSTNCMEVTVFYPSNINWRLETSTDLRGNFWRSIDSKDIFSTKHSLYGVVPQWRKYYLRIPPVGPSFFRAVGEKK